MVHAGNPGAGRANAGGSQKLIMASQLSHVGKLQVQWREIVEETPLLVFLKLAFHVYVCKPFLHHKV